MSESSSHPLRTQLTITDTNAMENFDSLKASFDNCKVIIFLDYDGTLSPIVNDPSKAILSNEMRSSVDELRKLFTTGIITGRGLSKIKQFVNIPELYYAGSHGFDICGPNGTEIKNQVALDYVAVLEEVRDLLIDKVATFPHAEVEDNKFSISLHYRNVDEKYHKQISEIAMNAAKDHPQLKCSGGKMVFEYKPQMDWNKGKAVIWLLQALQLDKQDNVFTIYIGDDTTDEDAFEVFKTDTSRKGAGIVVTDRSKITSASYTLHDTNQVCEFLKTMIAYGKECGAKP